MAEFKLTKKELEELRNLGIDTPEDGSDPGVEDGGIMQVPGGQRLISTRDDGWRKEYLKALHN